MPKVGPKSKHESNGVVVSPKSALARKLKDRLRGTDDVEISSPLHEFGAEDKTASWADVRKLVKGIRWMLKGWFPAGMLTGIIAEPKIGKSGFALGGLVRPIITGCNWFTGYSGPKPGYALWCDTEGSAAINIQRAEDWGLPEERIKVPFPDDPLRRINLKSTEHLDRIESVICHYRCRLAVIDSLRGAHGDDENNSRIAQILQALTEIAERTNVATVLIHHTRKLFEGEELNPNSGRGSNAFWAMVRCQIAIDRPDKSSEWRRVQVLGENLGIAPQPIGFRFTDTGLEFGEAPEKPGNNSVKDKAGDHLREVMKTGEWYLAETMISGAKQFGFSNNAIQRAREDLGITLGTGFIRQREDGKYEWGLPLGNK